MHPISSAQHFRRRPSSWHSHFRCLLCRCRHVPFSLHFHMYLLHPVHVYSHDDGLLLCLVCLVQGNKLIQYGMCLACCFALRGANSARSVFKKVVSLCLAYCLSLHCLNFTPWRVQRVHHCKPLAVPERLNPDTFYRKDH